MKQAMSTPARPLGRIAIADASAAVRSLAARVLGVAGFRVDGFDSVAGLVAHAKASRVDVALIDVALRDFDPHVCDDEFRGVNVVLTCPRDIDTERLAALEAGEALLVLVKPLTRQGLLHAVRQAVRIRWHRLAA